MMMLLINVLLLYWYIIINLLFCFQRLNSHAHNGISELSRYCISLSGVI